MVLGVNAWDEDPGTLREFADAKKLTHRILLDGSEVHARYGVPGVPGVIWINRRGRVVDAALGFDGPETLERKTRQLLRGG